MKFSLRVLILTLVALVAFVNVSLIFLLAKRDEDLSALSPLTPLRAIGYQARPLARHLGQGLHQPHSIPALWPSKLGFCTTGGWPSEIILSTKDAPVQVFVYEMEKIEGDDKLAILIAAVSEEKDATTTELLKEVLPSLRCDFYVGDDTQRAENGLVHRSSVALALLAVHPKKAGVAARLTCDLPPITIVQERSKHYSSDGTLDVINILPEALEVAQMDEKRRFREETYEWLHWQLSLPGLQSEKAVKEARSWLAGSSLPICNTTQLAPAESVWVDRMPSADDYTMRGDNVTQDSKQDSTQDSPGRVTAGLCVAPTTSTPAKEKWMNSSIDKWIHYQRNLVGFSAVFYLDPFGEDLLTRHAELSPSLGSGLLHVPHMAVRTSLRVGDPLSKGSVATALARERCSMLARKSNIDYILMVDDPMDLVVPLQRRQNLLPKMLASVTAKGCVQNIQMSSMTWSLENDDDGCDEAWCSLPDAFDSDSVSGFLMAGTPSALHETSEFRFYNSSARSLCKTSVFLSKDLVRVVRAPNGNTTPDESHSKSRQVETESIKRVVQGVAAWARHDIQLFAKSKEPALRSKRQTLSDWRWAPTAQSESIHLRSCRAFGEKGPHFGEAIVLERSPSLSKNNSSVNVALRLSFYNAETVTSPVTGLRSLSLSAYAESVDSIDFSLYHGWGMLFQSDRVQDLLRNVSCVFSHPDPVRRALAMPREVRTHGQWRKFEMGVGYPGYVWWLECPIPEKLPFPVEVTDIVSHVTIEAAESKPLPSKQELHMTRPVHLCLGPEQKGRSCDGISIACNVGCIDDLKTESDPQAQCCGRCHEHHNTYQRFDERDFWTPEVATALTSKTVPASNDIKRIGDLSICLKPFFLESISRENDNIDPMSPQRLVEWLEYHLLIGFDVIYVLDRFGTSLIPLLEPYVSAGRVVHVPFPLLSNVPLSAEARSAQTPFIPSAHEQVMAYDLCLSLARRRNDSFTALIDLDEFVRYPQAEAGLLRESVRAVLAKQWTNRTGLPDQIYLDRFDVETASDGFVLQYTTRFVEPRYQWKQRDGNWASKRDDDVVSPKRRSHGKLMANPQALVYGGVLVHEAVDSDHRHLEPTVLGGDAISIFHYRPYNKEKEANLMQKTEKREDKSLQWAHNILSVQFIGSAGWKCMRALSRQGLLRLKSVRRSSFSKPVSHSRALAPATVTDTSTRPLLLIGILSYCAARVRRDAIRQTWLSSDVLKASGAVLDVQWKFVLGQAPRSEKSANCREGALAKEAREFGDLVFLPDLPESYQVLTRKTLEMFKWANSNVNADFVLKTDDDSYVNVPALVSELHQVETSELPLYWGKHKRLDTWLSANTDCVKWYTKPEDLPSDLQTYAIGAGYLLSRPLVRHLASTLTPYDDALQLPWGPEERMGWLEDATVGYLLRGAVNRAGRVKTTGVQDTWYWNEIRCNSVNFVVHHLQSSEMLELHPLLFPTKDLYGTSCERLISFGVEPPETKSGESTTALRFGGSFLDRPVSPLSIAAPPPFEFPHMSIPTKLAIADGRDVIVVTGGLHNIGRHLVEKLQQGYSRMSGPLTILVLDSAARTDEEDGPSAMSVHIVVKKIDITDFEALFTAMTAYEGRIRGVVHLAAVSLVQECYSNKLRCEEVNVGGTKNILKTLWTLHGQSAAVTDSPPLVLPWLLFASSREVYGELGPDDVLTETSLLRPLNIFGETKLQAENAIRQWATKTGFNSVVLRFADVYGSCHDQESRPFPNLMSKLVSNEPLDIVGSADKVISLLHVQDAVQSLILAMRYADMLHNGAGHFEPFNIGGGPQHDVLSMKEIVRSAQSSVLAAFPKCKVCHHSTEIRVLRGMGEDRSAEPEHFRASIDKAFRVLGYQPSRSFGADSLSEYLKVCVK